MRRRTGVARVPGTQFSLSESPASSSKSCLDESDLESLEDWFEDRFLSVSSLPIEETVRESFRLFSPIACEIGVRLASAWTDEGQNAAKDLTTGMPPGIDQLILE